MKTDLYFDLLKKALTNTFFDVEPEIDGGGFVKEFTEHYIRGQAITMLPKVRLDNLQFCVEDVIKQGVPGDLIETGVWRGGATIFMRGILKAYEISDRSVWVADSFEGLPKPDAESFPVEAKAHSWGVMTKVYKHFAADLEEVQKNFKAYGMLDGQVHFLKGWFKDTLPSAPIKRLAVMRLDGDYYESTRDALVNLYHRLSPGGYVIIDDYAEDAWTYCRKAVDEFRAEHKIDDPLIRVDSKCYYWRRSK
jgi:O-methyltransferase